MPKNFDTDRQKRIDSDREFTIGGETFKLVSGVRPEVIAEYESIEDDTPASEAIKAFDGLIVILLEPNGDAEKRWRALRDREEDPITLDDMGGLITWALEVVTSRPTQPSSASSSGPKRTGTTSTEDSSSPVAKAA